MARYLETTLNDWKDIFNIDQLFLYPFIFRGQCCCEWELRTYIERESCLYDIKNYFFTEKSMIQEFRNNFHLYSNLRFEPNDLCEILATMQHHYAPTRLMDFTKSIFISSYFAVLNSITDSAIWALNKQLLKEEFKHQFKLDYDLVFDSDIKINNLCKNKINEILNVENQDFSIPSTVIPLNSTFCTERLARQQGLFLFPTNTGITFRDNLNVAFKNKDNFVRIEMEELIQLSKNETPNEIGIIKIIIPIEKKDEILYHLKKMNITSELLFPGLDGLCLSLLHKVMASKHLINGYLRNENEI